MSRSLPLLLGLLLLPPAVLAADAALRVGMDTRTPPWSYIPGLDYSKEDLTQDPVVTEAQLKRVEGLDADVANAIGRRLSVAVRVVPVSWFGEEAGLLAAKYDVIIGSWTPGPKTPPAIAASAPYLEWGLLIAVRSDNKRIHDYADLAGATVGHYRDPAAERTVRSLRAGKLVPYDDAEALFDDLKAAKLTAVLFDSVYVRWRVGNDRTFRAVGQPLNRLGYHVGVRRQDADLFLRVQAAVKSLVASGEMAEIQKRWEGGR